MKQTARTPSQPSLDNIQGLTLRPFGMPFMRYLKGIPKGRSVRPWMLSKEGWLGVLAVCFMVTFSGIYVLASGVPQVYTETSRVNRNLPLLLGPQRPETTYPFGGPVHN